MISETCENSQNLARVTILPSSLLLNVKEGKKKSMGVGGRAMWM